MANLMAIARSGEAFRKEFLVAIHNAGGVINSRRNGRRNASPADLTHASRVAAVLPAEQGFLFRTEATASRTRISPLVSGTDSRET
jgi:hypothetical protein